MIDEFYAHEPYELNKVEKEKIESTINETN